MKRIFAVVCGVLLFFSMTLSSLALTPAYQPSQSYQRSEFYTRLLALPETGDAALDTVAVAMSQLGYHEGNSTADLGGNRTSGSGNYTEYNYAFGKIGNTYSYAWCAAFVSFCLEESDSREAAGGLFASCTLWVERLQALGQYCKRGSGYTPKTGDLIFFRSAGTARASDHVGLVRYVALGRVYTVEGNSSDSVTLHDYALTDTYIVGYGLPAYAKSELSLDLYALSGKALGWYTVTNATLNLRAGASTSFQKLGQLKKGALVRVTELKNGWGRIRYNGADAWISLKYAAFTTPFSYRITYEDEEESTAVRYWSTEDANVPAQVPQKEGYRFLYWLGDDGARYEADAMLPKADLVLTPVLEAEPEPAAPPEDSGESESEGEAPQEGDPQTPEIDRADEAAPLPVPEPPDTAEEPTQNALATAAAAVASGVLTALLGALALCRKLFYP